MRAWCLVLSVLFLNPCLADEKKVTVRKSDLAKLMSTTQVIIVADLGVPASEFKSDGNPDSLEIVLISKPEDGPSRVSEDGEVIFQRDDTSDEETQKLITQAFGLRAVRLGLAQ